jgi:hypothetical protein
MSPEVALLNEVWDMMKDHISQKERLHEAEKLLRLFEDHIDISDIESYNSDFDKVMKAAILSHFDGGFDDEEEDDDDYY